MLKIATWNINSVRLRAEQVIRFLRETQPDVLCLQELKAATDKFPKEAFEAIGYHYQQIHGQPGYNGVGFIANCPIEYVETQFYCGRKDARHLSVSLLSETRGTLTLHGFYVPSGGDAPNRDTNDKFGHKLDFLDAMATRLGRPRKALLMGDLNVAPMENDVWSHKQMLKVVSHTPIEVEKLKAVQNAGGWIDAARAFTNDDEKLFSWWSYRSPNWRVANRGRRLDHIWVSEDLGDALVDCRVYDQTRDWEKPSDHVPVILELAA
jgi:exodeoxyribonuclease-3